MAELAHADQNRTAEFKRLLGQWNVRLGVALPALIIGGASAVTEPLAGLIIFVVLLLIALGVVFWIADSRAGKSFFDEYANSRNLVPSKEPLGRQTELLRSGDGQVTIRRWDGQLAPGLPGSVAHWSYAERNTGHDGSPHSQWFEHTVVMIPLDGLRDKLVEVNVSPAGGSPRSELERLRLESHELDELYDVSVHRDQDPNFVHRVFSPSFIVWLTEGHRPFQFGRGVLITSRPGHASSAAALDGQIAGACEIARELNAEASEGA